MKSNSNDTKIELTQNKYCIVDPIDYDLSNVKWCVIKQGIKIPCYRAMRKDTINGKYKTVLMHRVIMERILNRCLEHHEQVDHIDHNCLNNTRSNLRLVSNSQNQMNRQKGPNCSSKYKGVTWDVSRQLWISQIGYNGTHAQLGRYSSEIDAALTYDAYAKEVFGEFANLNFPDEK